MNIEAIKIYNVQTEHSDKPGLNFSDIDIDTLDVLEINDRLSYNPCNGIYLIVQDKAYIEHEGVIPFYRYKTKVLTNDAKSWMPSWALQKCSYLIKI